MLGKTTDHYIHDRQFVKNHTFPWNYKKKVRRITDSHPTHLWEVRTVDRVRDLALGLQDLLPVGDLGLELLPFCILSVWRTLAAFFWSLLCHARLFLANFFIGAQVHALFVAFADGDILLLLLLLLLFLANK